MKRLALLLLAALALVSCDDGITTRKYTKVHIQMEGGVPIHCEVLDMGTLTVSHNPTYEIKTQEYGWIVVHSNNFMLYKTDKCPICNR